MSANKNTAGRSRKHTIESEGYASVKTFRNGELIRELDATYITGFPDQLSISSASGEERVFVAYPELISEGPYEFEYIGAQSSSELYEGFMWYSYQFRTFRVSGTFKVEASRLGQHQVFQGSVTYKDRDEVMRIEIVGEVETTLK